MEKFLVFINPIIGPFNLNQNLDDVCYFLNTVPVSNTRTFTYKTYMDKLHQSLFPCVSNFTFYKF